MNVSVGLVQGRKTIKVELLAPFLDETGATFAAGAYELEGPVHLRPKRPPAEFAIPDVTIGICFHWERLEREVFRGDLRVIGGEGLTAINDVPIDEYVKSVISSEMSASCPLELLKAHAVISRSWLLHPKDHARARRDSLPPSERGRPQGGGPAQAPPLTMTPGEIVRWYGREAHQSFDVCADDHCQRYQGTTKAFSGAASQAVSETAGEVLVSGSEICDARFSKCCGGRTERYSAAWEDSDVPYLVSLYDGPPPSPPGSAEEWITGDVPAYCNTRDHALLAVLLPGFDQETRDFYRWTVTLSGAQIAGFVREKTGVDLGLVRDLQPLARGESGRIVRLKIVGTMGDLIVGKELEIRRALSPSHLYSSAFVVERDGELFVLRGAGWGHGVGLCQIGAAVMASRGMTYRDILRHYYPGTKIERRL